jgi:Phage tail assembly chaperone proteins, E, or 41 or 14
VSQERTLTISLHRSITYKGSKLDEITLNPPTIGQLRQAQAHTRNGRTDEAQTKFGIALVARVAGLDDDAVEQLDGDIFLQALKFVSGFLGEEETGSPKE